MGQSRTSNGYLSAFQVYTGKQGDTIETGLGAEVVKNLTQDLKSSHRHLYFQLLLYCRPPPRLVSGSTLWLLHSDIQPQRVSSAVEVIGEKGQGEKSKTCQLKNLTVSVWQDNKPVTIIATDSDPTQTGRDSRKHKDGSSYSYPCPLAVAEYNRKTGGVDYNDQLRGYYHVQLKFSKYYKYIFLVQV